MLLNRHQLTQMVLQQTESKFSSGRQCLMSFQLAGLLKRLLLLSLCLLLCSCFSALEHASSEENNVAQTSNLAGSRNSLRVITSGGFAAAYNVLEPVFEKQTGIDLQTFYGSSSGGAADSIPVRLSKGEKFDVLIMSKSSMNKITERGYVKPESRVDLVRSMIGMAVKEGAPLPDISTSENFVQVLENAKSIAYSASSSGRYLSTKLWPEMAVWRKIETKSKRILSERVATVVARGEAEIGFQQISEILPIKGAVLVAPIPQDLQKVTTFSIAITSQAVNAKDAKSLIEFLSSVDVADIISELGLSPVVLEL
ncbi:MAG: substrate-binding domain-containing protein [Arenicella sp.]|nr:substrate-binding domain-containing protein [Arenicella sp.]